MVKKNKNLPIATEFWSIISKKYDELKNIDLPCDPKGNPLIFVKKRDVEIATKKLGIIYTIQAQPCTPTGFVQFKRGFDDFTYSNYPFIQSFLHRAKSIFIPESDPDNMILLNGLPKFGGYSVGDDDEHTGTSSGLSVTKKELVEKTDQVVITTKENGKFAIMTCFELDGELYYFGGSKNVHHIIKATWYKLSGCTIESPLARDIFMQFGNNCTPELAKYLVDTKKCLVGEYCDGLHLVPLMDADKKPYISWFSIVDQEIMILPDRISGDAMDALEILTSFGLRTVKYEAMEYEEFKKKTTDYRLGTVCEGYVLYFLHDNKTIGIQKYKTWWYIVIRVVREYLKNNFKTRVPDRWEVVLYSRLLSRNRSFMAMPNKLLMAWTNLVIKFVKWFTCKMFNGEMDVGTIGFMNEFKSVSKILGMGNTWSMFLEESGESDQFDKTYLEDGLMDPMSFSGLALFFSAIPGVGKSVIAKDLIPIFEQNGLRAIEVNQDELVPEFGPTNAGKVCLQRFKNIMISTADDRPTIILITRNNSNPDQYQKYINIAEMYNWNYAFMIPKNLSSIKSIATCINSVWNRTGHETFDGLKKEKQAGIVMSFSTQFEPPTKAICDNIIYFDWLNETPDTPDTPNGSNDGSNPNEMFDDLYTKIAKFKKTKIPFKMVLKESVNVPHQQLLGTRIKLATICKDLYGKIMEIYNLIKIIEPLETSVILPIYFGAFIEENDKKQLISETIQKLREHDVNGVVFFGDKGKGKCKGKDKRKNSRKTFIDHTTFIYQFHENPVWDKLMKLMGTCVTIVIKELWIYQLDPKVHNHAGMVAVYPCHVIHFEFGNIDHLVISEYPHVTHSTPNNTPPSIAMKLLQSDQKPVKIIKFDKLIELSAICRGP